MQPKDFYQQQLKQEIKAKQQLEKVNTQLSVARLLVFIAAIAAFAGLFEWSWPAATISGTMLLIVFLVLVKLHLQKEQQLDFVKRKQKWYEDELKYQEFDFKNFPGGEEFEPQKHDYASDLDLFGQHSLFQYINRAQTFFGRQKLTSYLLNSSTQEEINERQASIKELKAKHSFRSEFLCRLQGLENKLLEQLHEWSVQEEKPTQQWMRWYRFLFMPLFWVSFLLIPFQEWASTVAFNLFLINVVFHLRFASTFSKEHSSVSKTAELIKQLTTSLQLIEKENFDSPLLKTLKEQVVEQHRISFKIKQLSGIVNYWDYRLNMIIYIIVANLFVWDVWWLFRVKKWKESNKTLIAFALDKLAEMEALVSLGTLHFNHPEWTFPTIDKESAPVFENLGHPLIPEKQRVNNSFRFKSDQELVFVSGSNMAGKSTFLRSIGINMVLAQMGAPVCAAKMTFRPVKIFSLMRIKDSLEENTSTFYFEIKRIKELLETVEQNDNVLYLLDELLRGTNSHDKHHGTEALIKWLMPRNGSGFIASHDLGLAEMENEHERFSNYHFDVKIENNKMDFDYKLRTGPCSTFNAAVLLREIGIEIE